MAGKDFKCGLGIGMVSVWSFMSGNSKCGTPKATTSVQDHLDVDYYTSTAECKIILIWNATPAQQKKGCLVID